MKQKEIRVLMVAPGEHPREVVLKNDLDSLQKAVSIGCDYRELSYGKKSSTNRTDSDIMVTENKIYDACREMLLTHPI